MWQEAADFVHAACIVNLFIYKNKQKRFFINYIFVYTNVDTFLKLDTLNLCEKVEILLPKMYRSDYAKYLAC